MSIRILCDCGSDITDDISMWDKKTRSVFWFEENAPACRVCAVKKTMRLVVSAPAAAPSPTAGRRSRRA
jgi:hypothetical protein